VFAAAARGVGAAPALTAHAGDDAAAAALRAALDVTPRRVPLPDAADADAAAQQPGDALLADAFVDDSGGDDASFDAEPLATLPPADAFAAAPPQAGALLLELLSDAAAVAPADAAATPPAEDEAAVGEGAQHTRACALLRSLAPHAAAPTPAQQPAAALALQLRYHDDDDGGAEDAAADASSARDNASFGADVAMADGGGQDDAADGMRVFTLEQCAVSDVGSGSAAGALMAFAAAQRPFGGGALAAAARALPAPPPVGIAHAAAPSRHHRGDGSSSGGACVAEEDARMLRGALLHALVIAPALTPSAAHVPMLPSPYVRDPSPPPAAAMLPPRPAAPAPLAAAELRLRWGEDAAMAPPPALRRRMARPEPAPPGEACAAMVHDAPPDDMLRMLDADAAAGGGDSPTAPRAQHAAAAMSEQEPPAPLPAPAPAAPPVPRDAHAADVPMRLVAPRAAAPAPGGAFAAPSARVLPTSLDADLAAFMRRQQRLSDADAGASSEPGGAPLVMLKPPPPPPLREHVVELPAEPHARLWRALRAAASGVAAREVARHDARDAAALLDAGGADLDALAARARALAAGGERAEPHVRALAAACVLLGAADALAQAGLRVAHAYLEGALRAAPALAQGALGAAAAPARRALDAAVAVMDDAPGRGALPPALPDAAVTDHPKARRCIALFRASHAASTTHPD
jgi:hypothetical protein